MQRAELYRLRGMFLAAIGGDEAQIEASFCAAINTAKEQKSMSLEKRAKATYAEYRRQKGSASGGRGIRLPLWNGGCTHAATNIKNGHAGNERQMIDGPPTVAIPE